MQIQFRLIVEKALSVPKLAVTTHRKSPSAMLLFCFLGHEVVESATETGPPSVLIYMLMTSAVTREVTRSRRMSKLDELGG